MTANASRSGEAFSEINVTPLADVMIVLLIIFMVVTPMMNDVPGLALPASRTAAEEQEGLVVLIRAYGGIEMGGEAFASPGELTIRLQARLDGATGQGRLVQVKADRGLAYGQVLAVLTACRQAGAERIALMATREIGP